MLVLVISGPVDIPLRDEYRPLRGSTARAEPGQGRGVDPNAFLHMHRVTYAECTVGDHVYYARYLDQFEAARGALFAAVGHPFRRLQDEGVIFPVVEAVVRYRSPARYDEVLQVGVTVTEARRFRLSFAYRVTGPGGVVRVEGETRHVCTDLTDRPIRLPAPLVVALEPHFRPVEAASDPSK